MSSEAGETQGKPRMKERMKRVTREWISWRYSSPGDERRDQRRDERRQREEVLCEKSFASLPTLVSFPPGATTLFLDLNSLIFDVQSCPLCPFLPSLHDPGVYFNPLCRLTLPHSSCIKDREDGKETPTRVVTKECIPFTSIQVIGNSFMRWIPVRDSSCFSTHNSSSSSSVLLLFSVLLLCPPSFSLVPGESFTSSRPFYWSCPCMKTRKNNQQMTRHDV